MKLETNKALNELTINEILDRRKKRITNGQLSLLVKRLTAQGFTQAQISEMTEVPARTISNWCNPKYDHNKVGDRDYDLDELIKFFNDFTPRLDQWGKLEKLKKIIENILG